MTTNAREVSAGLAVYLLPAEREKFGDMLRYFVSSVEANGAFTFNNLPPGRYHVFVQPLDQTTGSLVKLRLPEAAEARAKLRSATETYKTEVELKPCQNLTDHNVIFQP
ncbi:MAG: carboxypeptidase-like regulatory domain-containing protein [Acidobacteria bacterium]|nr:carboxypeptidase-like regulatory domain-containing protein [Acidobacteriota bacterium]MCA1627413.1 carboxypeptidase-like regulatory domain-containing protein [Acidobacteriota bacterium]